MKVILSGATGFIGGEALAQCLLSQDVTSIVLLSRRDIPPSKYDGDPRVEVVVLEDFTAYPQEALEPLRGAGACLWCLGSNSPDEGPNLVYPVKFMEAMAGVLKGEAAEGGGAGKVGGERRVFRHVHLSGAFTSRDQEAGLWFLSGARKMRGLLETKAHEFASSPVHEGYEWETIVFRPGGVFRTGTLKAGLVGMIFGDGLSIHADELGAAMVDVAVNGYKEAEGGGSGKGEKVVSNVEIAARGKEILRSRK